MSIDTELRTVGDLLALIKDRDPSSPIHARIVKDNYWTHYPLHWCKNDNALILELVAENMFDKRDPERRTFDEDYGDPLTEAMSNEQG